VTTTPASPAASQQAAVDAVLLMLKSMGLSVEDLTAAPSNWPPVPTFAEYVPVVAATLTPATLRANGSYWKRVIDQWGDRHLDEPTPSEIKQLVAYLKVQREPERPSPPAQCRIRQRAGSCLVGNRGRAALHLLPGPSDAQRTLDSRTLNNEWLAVAAITDWIMETGAAPRSAASPRT
jgi:hypothetical protein